MALRQLILSKRISSLKMQLEELRKKDEGFATRSAALKTREAELEAAVNEMTDEISEEDRKTVDESVASLETDQKALDTDQQVNDEAKKNLESEIQELQKELDTLDQRAKTPPAAAENKNGKDERSMNRMKFFGQMTREAVNAIITRDDVKEFLTRTRELIGQKRAVTGAELTIPEVMLDLLRDNLHRYSKLISKIRLKPVPGKTRQNIAGTIPEGVWTEAIGKINELALVFNQIEVDGYKVGGYIPIPNATLEDSDLNLANEIMDALGQALGYAVDKAILFGTGTKMPLGIATRLAQTLKPESWGTNAPTWTDLHTSNIVKFDPTSMTAEKFFATLLLNLGIAKPNYSIGGTFWAMNRKTKMALMSESVAFNAAGAIVAGQMGTMPIEGGDIVELEFIADNDIIGGFGSLYLLAERAGAQLAVSEHVKFLEDQTVFKGTARYDGAPAFGEGFVAINIANAAPTTTVSFASDTANP